MTRQAREQGGRPDGSIVMRAAPPTASAVIAGVDGHPGYDGRQVSRSSSSSSSMRAASQSPPVAASSNRPDGMGVEVLLDSPARGSFATRRAMFEAAAALRVPEDYATPSRRSSSSENANMTWQRTSHGGGEDPSQAKLEALERKVAVMLEDLSETKRRQEEAREASRRQQEAVLSASATLLHPLRRPPSARKPPLGELPEEEASPAPSSVMFSTPMSSVMQPREAWFSAESRRSAAKAGKAELFPAGEGAERVPCRALEAVRGRLLAVRAFTAWRTKALNTQRSILSQE